MGGRRGEGEEWRRDTPHTHPRDLANSVHGTHLRDLLVFAVHGGAQVNGEMLQAMGGPRQGTRRLQGPGPWPSPQLCGHRYSVSWGWPRPPSQAGRG